MSSRREYKIILQLISPFMFESVVNSSIGVDSAYLRDESGRPIIPMAQIKGIFRDALETLAAQTNLITTEEISSLFGLASPSSEVEQNRPDRGLALFADLHATGEMEKLHTTRIKIDPETGVVSPGSLQVVELAAPFGSLIDFAGKLVIRYKTGLDSNRIEKAISAAVRLIPSIGAYKSAGFGVVNSAGCSVSAVPNVSKEANANGQDHARITFLVNFDRPIVIDAKRIAENVFSGSTIVPGAVIKGALSEKLAIAGRDPERDGLLSKALADLYVSHCFPVDKEDNRNELDLPLPQSIVYGKKVSGELVFADALSDKLGAAPLWSNASQFEIPVADFLASSKDEIKSAFRVLAKTPTFEKPLLPRTHVSLNERNNVRLTQAERQYTAQDEMLYATNMVPTSGRYWQVVIDTSAIIDRAIASELINEIEQGLDAIGRTGATASFKRVIGTKKETTTIGAEDTVDLILKTPAVLFDPKVSNGNTADDYRNYFQKHFGAELLSFFATRRMAGGYLATRRRAYGNTYYPFILTEAGAVFRLKLTGSETRSKIEKALTLGLPCPDLDGKPAQWKTCPFLPEVGYGEVRLHNQDKVFNSDGLRLVEAL